MENFDNISDLVNKLEVGVYRIDSYANLLSANPIFLKLMGLDDSISVSYTHLDVYKRQVIYRP